MLGNIRAWIQHRRDIKIARFHLKRCQETFTSAAVMYAWCVEKNDSIAHGPLATSLWRDYLIASQEVQRAKARVDRLEGRA